MPRRVAAITTILLVAAASPIGGCASSSSGGADARFSTGLDHFDAPPGESAAATAETAAAAAESEQVQPLTAPTATQSLDLTSIFEQNALTLPSLARGNFDQTETPATDTAAAPESASETQKTDSEPAPANTIAAAPPPSRKPGPPMELEPFEFSKRTQADAEAIRGEPIPSSARLKHGESIGANQPLEIALPEPLALVETPDERKHRIAQDLRELLSVQAVEAGSPLFAAAALASLELVSPGASAGLIDRTRISPREQEALRAWSEMHEKIARAMAKSSAASDAGATLADAVRAAAERLDEWSPLDLSTMELCSRVDGFGVYTPLPGPRLLAGRAHRLIVYAEVERFSTKSATGAAGEPGYVVELSQEVNLFTDADGALVWRRPEETVRDFSRNKRRDFYMVQLIELPENLSVGSYRLKATIRDAATGGVAEAIAPIEIVADPRLVEAQED